MYLIPAGRNFTNVPPISPYRLFEKAQKGFSSLEQKAMDTADKLRVSRVKSSVKENLSRYRAAAKAEKGTERSAVSYTHLDVYKRQYGYHS